MAENEPDRLPFWSGPAARVAVGLVVGAGVTAVQWSHSGALALLSGWTALALIFTCWTWFLLWRFTPGDTKNHAEQEEPWHLWTVFGFILVGAVASLAGVVTLLERGRDSAALAIGSVVLSWFTIHTVYALLYARFYFDQEPNGGIDFNPPKTDEPAQPCFKDFLYIAFAVGMSFAVSDTNLTSTRMRTTALGQGLLSFAFGAIIIASVVNLIPNL